jgi:hypothetical protein
MEAPMAEEFIALIVERFTGEIASRLNKASNLDAAAESLNAKGLAKNAFETLINVEPLIFEATALLNAASIVNRSEDDDRSD